MGDWVQKIYKGRDREWERSRKKENVRKWRKKNDGEANSKRKHTLIYTHCHFSLIFDLIYSTLLPHHLWMASCLMNQHVSLITQHNWYRIDIDIFWLTNRLNRFLQTFQPASGSWSMIQLQSIEVKPLIHIPRNEDEKRFLVLVERNDWLWREAIRRIRSLFLLFFFSGER